MNLLRTNIGRLRLVAILEGISFLALLGIAMPLKYIWGMPEATMVVGMAHGLLFLLYILLIFPVKEDNQWGLKMTVLVFIASLLPFGTFVLDSKVLKSAQ